MRATSESGLMAGPRYPRASSRPVTDLGALAHGEPRVQELLELLELATEPGRRVYILQEIARVYRDDLGDAEAAAVALRAALQEDVDHGPVIGLLEEVADEIGWGELLTELMEDASAFALEDPQRAADLWLQIARWYDDPVGYRAYATRAVREALELVPHHREALATLSSLLREDGYWLELLGVLERQAAVTHDIDDKVAILLSIADVADSHLGDSATAIAACRSALDVDGSCQDAFDTLRSLLRRSDAAAEVAELLEQRATQIVDPDEYIELVVEVARIHGEELGDHERAERTWESIDDTPGAIARLTSLIDRASSPAERAALHYRIGWFWLRGDSDEARAEWHLSQAVAEAPDHAPSLQMLAGIYRLRGDWRKASNMLSRATNHADSERTRAELILENARILADQLGDLDAAAALCEGARERDPGSSAVARMLASLYARLGRWSELQPLLAELEGEIVGQRARPDEVRTLYFLIARSAAELGDDDRALAYFYEARRVAPNDTEVLRGLADQYFARSRWKEAAAEYRALLTAGPAPADEAAIRYRLGVALRWTGDREAALDAFRRVTELEPDHLPAAEAVADLLTTAGRWRDAARAKRRVLELAPPDELHRLHVELGDLYRDHLREPRHALEEYEAAVGARPDDHAALQRRLDLATTLGDWPRALDSIDKFVEAETVARRRGSYLHAAAVIQRDELNDEAAAAALYERALDAFFADNVPPVGDELTRFMKTFVALDELHTRRRDWTEQARAYRRMIRRLPAGHALLGDLWHALGEIYRSRLKRYQEAAAAFEVARSLDPDNVDRREILAELYEVTGGEPAAAAAEHHEVLARDPGRADSYRALKEIYIRTKRHDQAWCACRALVFLERATPEERELYERYQASAPAVVKAPITPELRGRLVHPDESGVVATAFGIVRAALANTRPSNLALKDNQRCDARSDDRSRIRLLAHVAAALALPQPEIYDQARKRGSLAFGLARVDGSLRPVLAARSDYLGLDAKSAAYTAGCAISLLEPARVLAVLFSDAELRSIAAWIAGEPDDGELRRQLDGPITAALRPDEREQLQGAHRALTDLDWEAQVTRWIRAAVITADRAGLVMSGDLTASARMIAGARGERGGLAAADRILEILRYSVTDAHAAIRRRLCGRI